MENDSAGQLTLYYNLNLAIIDYLSAKFDFDAEMVSFNAKTYFEGLREEMEKLRKTGDIAALKKSFDDYVSVAEERGNHELKEYVTAKTGYKFI